MPSSPEHPSNHEISAINCPSCQDVHELEDIQPLVYKYEDEPHFNHFEFSCGDARAKVFDIPDKVMGDLELSGVPIATGDTPMPEVITRYQEATGTDYHPADKLDMLDVAEFHERLDAVDSPDEITW